jgi:hypothetical protein
LPFPVAASGCRLRVPRPAKYSIVIGLRGYNLDLHDGMRHAVESFSLSPLGLKSGSWKG